MTDRCRHCGGPAGSNVYGLCDACFRKSTVLFSQKPDGTYQCGLCLADGVETSLEVGSREAHMQAEHSIDPDDRLTTIREWERIHAGTDHRQVGLGEVVE